MQLTIDITSTSSSTEGSSEPNLLLLGAWGGVSDPVGWCWATWCGDDLVVFSSLPEGRLTGSIMWMNWNSGSSMSGAILNSRFLTSLLISGEEDFECVSVLKEDTLSIYFVRICYIQCDLIDCCIFNYEIMPAALALYILQGNALADLECDARF